MLDLTRPGWRRRLTLAVIAFHRVVFRASGGRVLGRVAGMPVLLLTTTGRRTGRQRTTPLTYLRDGDALVLIASAGGSDGPPAWSLNLDAGPEVVVRRGRRTERRRARRASVAERDRLWPEITATYQGYARYQARTAREIPVYLLEPVGP
jgi:deazaflavin-dependent oxidoreductase (nitroreductase family)